MGTRLASAHIQVRSLLPIPRLRIPTHTRIASTRTSTRRPRSYWNWFSSRAHRQVSDARSAALWIQQTLEEVLQYLVLRRARRACRHRGCQQ